VTDLELRYDQLRTEGCNHETALGVMVRQYGLDKDTLARCIKRAAGGHGIGAHGGGPSRRERKIARARLQAESLATESQTTLGRRRPPVTHPKAL
jgi:hypothetical protein